MSDVATNGGPGGPEKMYYFQAEIVTFRDGIRTLKAEQRGVYLSVLLEIYDSMGPVQADYRRLSLQTGLDARLLARVVPQLVATGKLYEADGWIHNSRAEKEIADYIAGHKTRSEAARIREAEKRNRRDGKPSEIDELRQQLAAALKELSETSLRRSGGPLGDVSETSQRQVGHVFETTDKKTNEINETKAEPYHKKGSTRGREEFRTQNIEEEIPPNPQWGGGEVPSPRRAAGAMKRAAEKAEARTAIKLYNQLAAEHGWTIRTTVSDQLVNRMAKRLEEIGGFHAFETALGQVQFVPFLMGRMPGRDGGDPFKLDIDRLLSTKSGLGDVLAKLLDRAAAGASNLTRGGKSWGWWRQDLAKLKGLSAAVCRELIDKAKPNGEWPWDLLGAPPGDPECFIHPDVLAESGYVAKYQGNIKAQLKP